VDPRPAVVARRLAGVRRIVAVTGGKGGIGKSSVAVGLALGFAGDGARVGLLDLDLWGPSDHVILGVPRPSLREDGGLVPATVAGMAFMTIASIVGERPALLRGEDVTNAILELLAVTIWGDLDVLVVDMPPGFGDTLLDAVRYLPRAEYVVVATPSELTLATTRKTIELLRRLELPVLGMVENLRREGDAPVPGRLGSAEPLPLLGVVHLDADYERSLGSLERLAATRFISEVTAAARRIAEPAGPEPGGSDGGG
jgi:ATP-binding protein involved in chromosome partitioning